MKHSDIRKHLKKGEQAVDVLESLGYQYVANGKEHPHWVAPVNPIDPLLEGIKDLIAKQSAALIKEETAKAYLAGEASGKREYQLKGPNWDNVKDLKGKWFEIVQGKIPVSSKLAGFGSVHFAHKRYQCLEVRYHRSLEYTGYAVLFNFPVRPFIPETVWLPLGACVFRDNKGEPNAHF